MSSDATPFARLRVAELALKVEASRLALDEEKSRLLDAAAANAAIDEIAGAMRDALLNWTARVSGLIAADRSGATLSAVLEADNAMTLAQALGPAVALDAILAPDAGRSLGACARLLGLSHQPINHTPGERVRGELHIQTVNSRAERLKDMLRHHRGVATRYLGNYRNWFHLVTLNPNPSSRTCLSAAIGQKHAEMAYA